MTRPDIIQRLLEAGAVAVLRLPDSRHTLRVAEAVAQGGITAVEVTLTTPDALATIEQLARQMPGSALIGVGSVLNADDVAQAAGSGARFIVSPITTHEIIKSAHENDLPVIPGALTPTEVYHAQALGADFVKVFPASFWGPKYVRALLAPMPHLRLCPTGGVTPHNAGEWIQAGAKVVGIGSALVNPSMVAAGNYEEITRRARTLARSIKAVR